MYICVCMHACVCMCKHVFMYAYVCASVHAYVYKCVHYPHESVGTHMCTYMQRPEDDITCC